MTDKKTDAIKLKFIETMYLIAYKSIDDVPEEIMQRLRFVDIRNMRSTVIRVLATKNVNKCAALRRLGISRSSYNYVKNQ